MSTSKIPTRSRSKSKEKSGEKEKSRSKSSSERLATNDNGKLEKTSKRKSTKDTTSKSPSKSTSKSSNKENRPSKKSSENERKEKKTKKEKVPENVPEPEEENYDYEDDFEEYSDDFEEDDEDSVKEKEEEINNREKDNENKSSLEDDDDFEEYSDDFEEDDEDSVKEKKEEINNREKDNENKSSLENDMISQKPTTPMEKKEAKKPDPELSDEETPMMRRLKSSKGQRPPPPERKNMERESREMSRIPSGTQRKISFDVGGSGGNIYANYGDMTEQEKRYKSIRQLIGIETTTVHILNKAPVKDYDFYLELFGDNGKTQSFTQTGDDNADEETQTEETEMEVKWTQQPALDDFGWGIDDSSKAINYGMEEDDDLSIFKQNHLQNPKLKEFMEVAGQVIIELLSSKNRTSEYIEMHHRTQLPFSVGYNILQLGPVGTKVRTSFIVKSGQDDNVILGAFYVTESNNELLINRSLLVEFYIDQIGPPQRLYLCESEVRCCTYSPDGTALFAGLADGSCVAWDLLEPSASFNSSIPWLDAKENLTLRTPAYDTSFLSNTFSQRSKTAAGVHICTVSKKNDLTYQVACLDQSGTVSIWSVLRDANTSTNLGVRPGSRLAMGLVALLRPDPSVVSSSSDPTFLIANCMASNPVDPFQFIVGTDAGFLMSMSRNKGSSYTGPRLYNTNMHAFGEILCVKFSPADPTVILAGLSTGSLSFHKMGQPGSLLVLTPPQSSRTPVTSVEWNPVCPSAFYSIHDGRRLLTWDLTVGKTPISVCELDKQFPEMVFCTHIWMEKAAPSDKTGIAYLALGLENGEIQIHALEPMKTKLDTPTNLYVIIKRL